MSHVTYKYLFSPKSFDIIIRARYHHDIRVALNVTSSEMRENKYVVCGEMMRLIVDSPGLWPVIPSIVFLCFYVHSICHIIFHNVYSVRVKEQTFTARYKL